MAEVNPMLEKAARALSERHWADFFGIPGEHQMVRDNVEATWRDYLGDAWAALRAVRTPDAATVQHAVKHVKDRSEAVERFEALIDAITG